MTDHFFKGHWQNEEGQDAEILNYGRKWNYLHKFGTEKDDMMKTKMTE